MTLETILMEYGKAKHLGKLQLDSSGVCTLLFNKNYLVTFEKSLNKDGFYVFSSIGTMPPNKEQEISLMVLKGNLFGKETGQASIGYVEQTRTLVLFEYFDNNTTDFTHFSQRLNQFLQHLFYWVVKLESTDQSVPQHTLKNDILQAHAHKKIFYA